MKLALGCVQFGLAYGVTNKVGQVPLDEISKILAYAKQVGINTLDTAAAYGTSEQVLGQLACDENFDIITKIPSLSDKNTQAISDHVSASLAKLKVKKIKALMFHNANDLLNEGGDIYYQEAKQLITNQTIRQLGVSIYQVEQLTAILNQFSLDIIQLPVNWLDQRFLTKKVAKLISQQQIEIHARSLFLQGILLQPIEDLPPYFLPFKSWIEKFQHLCQRCNCQPLTLALAIIHHNPLIEKAVVGCCSLNQIEEIVFHYHQAKLLSINYSELLSLGAKIATSEQGLINPSLWSI